MSTSVDINIRDGNERLSETAIDEICNFQKSKTARETREHKDRPILLQIKIITIITLLALLSLTSCGSQSENETDLPSGQIISYLPMTFQDNFELTSLWHFYHQPHGKIDFSYSELMLLYDGIKNFVFYGYTDPWLDEILFGVPPFLIANGEMHETRVYFTARPNVGAVALAIVDNEHTFWFAMDEVLQRDILSLIGW